MADAALAATALPRSWMVSVICPVLDLAPRRPSATPLYLAHLALLI